MLRCSAGSVHDDNSFCKVLNKKYIYILVNISKTALEKRRFFNNLEKVTNKEKRSFGTRNIITIEMDTLCSSAHNQ